MSWIKPTRDDLLATISEMETSAFAGSSELTDAVEAILARTAALVRGYVRAGGVRCPADAALIPPSLLAPAMDYAAFDLLKRFDIVPNEARSRARTDAIDLFTRVGEGKMAIAPDDETAADAVAGTPAVAPPTPARLLD